MSDTTSTPVWGVRAVRAGVLSLALAALAALGLASQANADFTTGKCGGVSTNANGASFAKGAQESFNSYFKTFYCSGAGISVTYNANGSGAGIEGAELRPVAGTSRFWGSDDPPTQVQRALMNSGAEKVGEEIKADASEGNNGKVHIFPVAAGAIAPLVNFPEGCDPEKLADKYRTVSAAAIAGTPALKGILRVRITKQKFEKLWAGEENAKWTEAFPELEGAACEVPIIRVVRFDKSGTTFGFKDYLRSINEGRGWTTTYETGTGAIGNREWPNAVFGDRSATGCPGKEGPGSQVDTVDFLTSACGNGNGELVKTVVATDGSIGYSDVATARNNSTTLAVNAALATAPTTAYWTQVQNGSVGVGSAGELAGEGFTEPTLDEANGFKTTAASNPSQKGANCIASSIYQSTPADSFGDWSKASAVDAPSGFGICTLTYAMVFDDNAAAFGNTPEEEAKARTVKDYEESLLTDAAQAQLLAADYAPLSPALLTLARKAVAEIGWNKSSTSTPPPTDDTGKTPPPSGGPSTPITISNKFSLLKKSISSKTGGATISVKLPGAGKLDVLGTAKSGKKGIKVGHSVLTAGKAGTYNVTLKPTGAAKAMLKKTGSLKVALKLTFSPTGGTPSSSNSSVTLKLVKKKK